MNWTSHRTKPVHSSAQLLTHRMNYLEYAPDRDLADYVLDFWQIATVDPVDVVPSQLFATDLMRIRFMIFEDRLLALVYGPSISPHRKGLYLGNQVSFGATLLPTAARHLFGYDVAHFRDLRLDLGVLWPDETETLCEQISCANFHDRVQILGNVLRRKIANIKAPNKDFVKAYSQLVAGQGGSNIGSLCRNISVSQRTLNRLFQSYVGMSPKECARILRLHKRLNDLSDNRVDQDAVEGFSDQSHWIREFKAMVGVPPHRYFSELHTLHEMNHGYWKGTDVSHYIGDPSPIVRFPDWHPRNVGAF